MWDLATQRIANCYKGHKQSMYVVRACYGGYREKFIASGSEDAAVYIWHADEGVPLRVLRGHSRYHTDPPNHPRCSASAHARLVG